MQYCSPNIKVPCKRRSLVERFDDVPESLKPIFCVEQ